MRRVYGQSIVLYCPNLEYTSTINFNDADIQCSKLKKLKLFKTLTIQAIRADNLKELTLNTQKFVSYLASTLNSKFIDY